MKLKYWWVIYHVKVLSFICFDYRERIYPSILLRFLWWCLEFHCVLQMYACLCVVSQPCVFDCISCYSGVHFNSQAIAPTIEQIDQSFGATHPGGRQPSIRILLYSSSLSSSSSAVSISLYSTKYCISHFTGNTVYELLFHQLGNISLLQVVL